MSKTTIRKSKPKAGYMSLPNSTAQNGDLSYEALGMLTYIQSLPENWVLHVSTLPRVGCGRDKAYRIISELLEKGYARRTKVLNKKRQVLGVEYEVSDLPDFLGATDTTRVDENPLPEIPYTENPDTESPYTENPTLQSKEVEKEKKVVKKESAPRQRDLFFEAVSLQLFKLDYANEVHKPDIKANQGRIAKISNYLKEKGASLEQFSSFIADYKQRNPDIDLPLDLAKFSKYFSEFLTRASKPQNGAAKKGSFGRPFVPDTTPESKLKGNA